MPTVDQRDLSLSNYDYALDMYRQKAKEAAARSQGLERFLYSIFGSQLMGSIACAIDPWAKFRFSKVKIAPTNRTRSIPGISAATRSFRTTWHDTTKHAYQNSTGSRNWTDSSDSGPPSSYVDDPQKAINGFIKDTTRRTRGFGIDYGEFELFIPKFESSGSGFTRTQSTYVWVDFQPVSGDYQLTDGQTTYTFGRDGPSYLLDPYWVSSSASKSRATSVFAKRGLEMVSRCLPTARRYNSVYQIGELKDLPMLFRGTMKAWRDFEAAIGTKKFVELLRNPAAWDATTKSMLKQWASSLHISNLDKDASNAYLCYKFGWESIVSAVDGLIRQPEKVAKEINYLINRNGKMSSFRSMIHWIEKEDSPPIPYLRGFSAETNLSSSNSGFRECELRCVVNATFEFPLLDLPRLRAQLWTRKLGLDPRPSDIYDLIPWTWLIDWFSGLGDYIHAMDNIYQDQSLINYGFLTYKERVRCTSTSMKQYQSNFSGSINGASINRTIIGSYSISGVYSHKYMLRMSLGSVAGIKTPTSDSLTSTQKLILGALFGAKNNIGAQVARR